MLETEMSDFPIRLVRSTTYPFWPYINGFKTSIANIKNDITLLGFYHFILDETGMELVHLPDVVVAMIAAISLYNVFNMYMLKSIGRKEPQDGAVNYAIYLFLLPDNYYIYLQNAH